MTIGFTGQDLEFDADDHWEKAPEHVSHRDVSAVGVDSKNRVFLFTRADPRVLIYRADGSFDSSWGEGYFVNPHGLTIAPDDSVFCVDNADHTVKRFTPDGDLLMTIGTPGSPSDTGYVPVPAAKPVIHKVETIQRPAGPFNACTNIAIAPSGELYVTDGYGNCCVHRFTPDGELISSWGGIGVGPGEFHLPHGIGIDQQERVYVCDRENDRIQIFAPNGEFLMQWTDIQRPTNVVIDADGYVYVSELWRPRSQSSFVHGLSREDHPGRVTIFDKHGVVVARWGASTVSRGAKGNFIAPHDIAVDKHGDVYVAEVTYSHAISAGLIGDEYAGHQIQKFSRKR